MQTKRRRKWPYLLILIILLGSYSYWALHRPLPLLQPATASYQFPSQPTESKLTWPAGGQSAVGLLDTNILETNGSQTPVPIASVAKVITALVVLEKKPLAPGQQGPIITLTPNDVALFNTYYAQDGSLVPVVAGEQISQYQMLQAIMLPSANNMADSMAIWAFGSLPAYATAANTYLKQHGLNHTTVGTDASGLSPTTTSTAGDLVKLGELAMKQPVLTQIVAQPTAIGIPQTTSVRNYNSLLGTANIIGIKTGNTEQAGGVFLSASKVTINDKPVTIITALAGSPDLATALHQSLALVQSTQANFGPAKIITHGDKVATYKAVWGPTIDGVATQDLNTTYWNGSTTNVTINPWPIGQEGSQAGTITLPASALNKKQVVSIAPATLPAPPSIWWRLTHPIN